MPNMNLKGDGTKIPPPGIKTGGGASAQSSSTKIILIVLGGVLLLAVAAFVLNKTGVVHLWGKKKTTPVVVAPAAEQPSDTTAQAAPSDSQVNVQAEQQLPTIENKTKVEALGSKKAEMFAKKSMELKQGKAPSAEKKSMSTGGNFTVQISSWEDKAKATTMAKIFEDAGFDSFVQTSGKWYRVCIGRYATRDEAKAHGEKLVHMLENNYTVIKVGK